jgi:hypothetical protein
VAQAESVVEPDRVADDIRREPVALVCHHRTILVKCDFNLAESYFFIRLLASQKRSPDIGRGYVMRLKIEGKGILCRVYYVDAKKFERLEEINPNHGLKDLIDNECDQYWTVSKGFFADDDRGEVAFRFINEKGELLALSSVDHEAWAPILGPDNEFVLDGEMDDGFVESDCYEPSYPRNDQVVLVYCEEFDHGSAEVELNIERLDEIKTFSFICNNVDCEGFVGEVTYHETIVGGPDNGNAETAILAIEVNGEKVEIDDANFDNPQHRIWLYVYDEEEDEHSLDFLRSKKQIWSAQKEETSGKGFDVQRLIKRSMRVTSPCKLETYAKEVDGVQVVVQRFAIDDWNDIELTMGESVDIPESGISFSTRKLGIDYDIIDISSSTQIGHTLLSPSNGRLEGEVEADIQDDCWDDWELIEEDYTIENYEWME